MDESRPKTLIVGSGIGGLMLAILLERACLPYEIFEKSTSFKPLGSAINLNAQVFTVLDQLGIFSKLEKVSLPYGDLKVHSLNSKTGQLDYKGTMVNNQDHVKEYGYDSRMIARPDLMEILLQHVPIHKIRSGKRILSIQQNMEGVMIRAADGSTFHGDICVGADGCYSPVRESMFKGILQRGGKLSKKDLIPMRYDLDCVVGVTEPLEMSVFLEMKRSEFQVTLLKDKGASIWYMPLSRNRMGWMVNSMIPKQESKKSVSSTVIPGSSDGSGSNLQSANNFKQTEWTEHAAEEMCDQFRECTSPYGTPLKTFIDKTPKELVSKVMLEHKFFDTWQDGRTCLIGDACHKVLPFGAQGATQAILDAVALANLIYDLPTNSYQEIRKALQEYEIQRKPHGKAAVEASAGASMVFHTHGITGPIIRRLVLHTIPPSLIAKGFAKVMYFRLQATFLPMLENKGSVPMIQQKYSPRYLKEKEDKDKKKKSSDDDKDAMEEQEQEHEQKTGQMDKSDDLEHPSAVAV